MFRESGDPLELIQTEDVQYKLGGLVLSIGGIGRNNADGKLVLQALAIIPTTMKLIDNACALTTMAATWKPI